MARSPHSAVQRFAAPLAPQRVAPGVKLPGAAGVQRFSAPSGEQGVTARRAATSSIRALAERQHGVVAWRQLIDLGLSEGLIKGRIRAGHLVPLHRGVFAVGHRRIDIRGRWLAAVLACGPSAVLSYGSAAQLWEMRGSRGPIEVTRRSGHRRPHGVRLHQTRSLPPEHVAVVAGIPVTTPERTALDMASRLDSRQMERLLVAGDRAKHIRWPELNRVIEAGVGRKGRGMLRRVSLRVSPHAVDARSNPEIDFLALFREASLPEPEVNVLVEGRLVDFFWPRERLVIEVDSYHFHGDRLSFEQDHESTLALVAAGYKVLRPTDEMLEGDIRPFLNLVRDSLHPGV